MKTIYYKKGKMEEKVKIMIERKGAKAMSKADKMFEELGFEKIDTIIHHFYKNGEDVYQLVVFNECYKNVTIEKIVHGVRMGSGDIKVKLLEAIHEKMKELGWIE